MNHYFNTSIFSNNGNNFICLFLACFLTFSQLTYAQSIDITYTVSEIPEQYLSEDIPLCDKVFYNFTATPDPDDFPGAISYEYEWSGGAIIQDDDEQVALVAFFGAGQSFIEVQVIGYDANGNVVANEDETMFFEVQSNSDITFDIVGNPNSVCQDGTLSVNVSVFERAGNGQNVNGTFMVFPEEAGEVVTTTSLIQQTQNSQGINYTDEGLFTPDPDYTGSAVLVYVFERGNGCQKSGSATIEIYNPINAVITTNDAATAHEATADICSEDALQLYGKPTGAGSGEDGFHHEWSVSDVLNGTSVNPASVLDNPSSRTPEFTPPANAPDGAVYQLVYTADDFDHNEGRCPSNSSDAMEITVRKTPDSATMSASSLQSCDAGNSINLSFDIVQGNILPAREYTVVFNDGNSDVTVPNYQSGADYEITPNETTTYTLVSVVDQFGCNVDVINSTLTVVVDDDAPVFDGTLIEFDQDINMDEDVCEATIPNFINANHVSDACNVTITQTPAAGESFGGTHNDTQEITITATDEGDRFSSYSFTLTLKDNQQPTFSGNAPNDQNVIMTADACSGEVPNLIGNADYHNDNCSGGMAYVQNPAAGSTFGTTHGNTQDVVITITDDGGNSRSRTVTLTLIDNQDPTTTLSDSDLDKNAIANDGVCYGQIPDLRDEFEETVTDCSPISVSQFPAAGSDFGDNFNRTEVVTVTATDVNGNTVSRDFTITLIDEQDPNMPCTNLPNLSYTADEGSCLTTFSYIAPVATDNCELTMKFRVNDSPKFPIGQQLNENYGNGHIFMGDNGQTMVTFPAGVYDFTFFAEDADENISTCEFTVTILDDQNPTFSEFGDDVTVSTDGINCGSDVTVIVPTGADNCEVASVSLDGVVYTVGNEYTANYEEGTTTLTWIVTDASGNTFSQNMDIIVNDNTDPILSQIADIVGETDAPNCSSSESWTHPTPTDGCGIKSVETNNGITYSTNTDPQIPITVENGIASATFPKGTTIVSYSIEDINGNKVTKYFTVTILDNDAPSFTNPTPDFPNVLTGDGNYDCKGVLSWSRPGISDNCGASIISVTRSDTGAEIPFDEDEKVYSGHFPVGETTVNYIIKDAANNTATSSFKITVADSQAPRFNDFPGDQDANVDADICGAFVSFSSPNPFDNCTNIASSSYSVTNGVVLTENNDLLSGTFPVGTTVVTYTATDENGLTANRNFNVVVDDNIFPVVTAVDEVFANSADDANCTFIIPDLTNVVNIIEACAYTVEQSPAAGTIVSGTQGNEIPVVVTVTDASNNATDEIQNITLNDILAPVFTSVPTLDNSYDSEGACTKSITLPLAEATDNCDGDRDVEISFGVKTNTGVIVEPIGLSFNPQVLPNGNFVADYPVGTTVVTFTTTDTKGNENETSIEVVVTGIDASFSANAATHPFAPFGVQLTADYLDGVTYEWTFGNGLTGSGQQTLAGYGTPGTYEVTLTVNGCVTETQTITVGSTAFVSQDNGINENAHATKLGYFTTQTNGKDVEINWGTVNEVSNEVFVIEHSTDGESFETIEEAPGNGNILNDYQILHENAEAGKNFYRVRFTNNDGTFSFSDIATAKVAAAAHKMVVYPNPTKEFVMVQVPENFLGQQVLIEVFDLRGNAIISQQNADDLGTIRLDLSQVAAGNYIIRAVCNSIVITKPLVIIE